MTDIARVIVGTSGSPGSLNALRFAEVIARAHDAVLIPVIAWEPPNGNPADVIQPLGYLRDEWPRLACDRLKNALMTVWGEVPTEPWVQPRIERGPTGWVLVNLAREPGDLLVVGARRRGKLARIASSGVSGYCLTRARCPVLAVPPPALARAFGHRRLARMLWQRPLTMEKVLREKGRPTT